MKYLPLLPLLAAMAIVAPVSAQEQSREEIHKLAEKARQAKADGRLDEANEIMNKVKKLEAAAGGQEKKEEGGDHFSRMKREIEELRRAGRNEDAENLERRLREAWNKKHGESGRPAEGNLKERAQHVMEAVRHLRAAGLNDPAGDLEKVAHRMREEAERQHSADTHGDERSKEKPHAAAAGEVRQLREQVERLTREMEKMREHLKGQKTDAGRKE